MKNLILMAFLFSRVVLADALACSTGENIWGENLRTGKAFGPNPTTAQELAFTRFLNSLAPLLAECHENGGTHLEFGPIQSFSGIQKPQGHSGTFAVNVGCCSN